MAWYDGKSIINAFCFGDSNLFGYGLDAKIGVQTYNDKCFFYAPSNADVPYDDTDLSWRKMDNDLPSRFTQIESSVAGDLEETGFYQGQIVGGNGSPTMQMASTVQQLTGCDSVYAYLAARGGCTSGDWLRIWDDVEAAYTTALAAIPGSPTAPDIIYISVGGGDLYWSTPLSLFLQPNDFHHPFTSPTAEEFYENFLELRQKMIDKGWWIPGTTQIVLTEIPRSYAAGALDAYPAWKGLEYATSRTNDRIAMVTSASRTYDPAWTVHFSPKSYTDMGREAGEMVVAQIPMQRARLTVGGSRLTIGDDNLRAQGAL